MISIMEEDKNNCDSLAICCALFCIYPCYSHQINVILMNNYTKYTNDSYHNMSEQYEHNVYNVVVCDCSL